MTVQKRKGSQRTRAAEAFEHENKRSDLKIVITETNEKQITGYRCKTTGIPGNQVGFSDKVTLI